MSARSSVVIARSLSANRNRREQESVRFRFDIIGQHWIKRIVFYYCLSSIASGTISTILTNLLVVHHILGAGYGISEPYVNTM